MRTVLTFLFTLLCWFAHTQQVSLYDANKFGIGLNGDKTFSPEIILKLERHSFFTNYWMLYPEVGCKIRYVKNPRAYIYSAGYLAGILAYDPGSGDFLYSFVPDVHVCGIEVYPFDRDYLGVSMYARSLNFESLRGYWALLVRF